jgi:hypothetical protein
MGTTYDHDGLAGELRGLMYNFYSGDEGMATCSAWWSITEASALGGDPESKFKVMGSIGALCVWVGKDYTDDQVIEFLAQDQVHYDQIAQDILPLLNVARNTPSPENSKKFGEMIWQYVEAHPEGNARLMFGALISLLRPVMEEAVKNSAQTSTIAFEELVSTRDDPDKFKLIWRALVGEDKAMNTQLGVIIALAKAAIGASGPAPYAGLTIDGLSFVGYEIATCLANDDLDTALHVAGCFLMSVPDEDTHELAAFFARHIR